MRVVLQEGTWVTRQPVCIGHGFSLLVFENEIVIAQNQTVVEQTAIVALVLA